MSAPRCALAFQLGNHTSHGLRADLVCGAVLAQTCACHVVHDMHMSHYNMHMSCMYMHVVWCKGMRACPAEGSRAERL